MLVPLLTLKLVLGLMSSTTADEPVPFSNQFLMFVFNADICAKIEVITLFINYCSTSFRIPPLNYN